MANNMLAVSYAVPLMSFDNLTLAVLNTQIQMSDHVSTATIAYQPALDASLIKENGYAHDLEALRDACAYEVNRRVRAGTFH